MSEKKRTDADHEGRNDYFMDIDRMVNEGLGGGIVSPHNGLIEDTTVDTMRDDDDDLANDRKGEP